MRSSVAGLVLLCVSACDAFNVISTPLQTRTAAAKLDAVPRASLRAAPSSRGGALALQAGIYGLIDYKYAKRPEKPEEAKCACGSGLTYSKCCEEWHDRGEATDPLVLIKSRYSAYAYCLPEFIIATTQKKGPEWVTNTDEWEQDLLAFCNDYDFVSTNPNRRLGLIIEQCKYQGDDKAELLFKALMTKRNDPAPKLVELWEKSTVIRESNYWVYNNGVLQDYAGPML